MASAVGLKARTLGIADGNDLREIIRDYAGGNAGRLFSGELFRWRIMGT
jgi:hypothetical protein